MNAYARTVPEAKHANGQRARSVSFAVPKRIKKGTNTSLKSGTECQVFKRYMQ